MNQMIAMTPSPWMKVPQSTWSRLSVKKSATVVASSSMSGGCPVMTTPIDEAG